MKRRTVLASALPFFAGCASTRPISSDLTQPDELQRDSSSDVDGDILGKVSLLNEKDVESKYVEFDLQIVQEYFTTKTPPKIRLSIGNKTQDWRLITGGAGFPFTQTWSRTDGVVLRDLNPNRRSAGAKNCWVSDPSLPDGQLALMDGEKIAPESKISKTQEVWLIDSRKNNSTKRPESSNMNTSQEEENCIPHINASIYSDEYRVDPLNGDEEENISWGASFRIESM